MSIGMTPFTVLYEYEPLSFMDIVLGDSCAPRAKKKHQEGQDILRLLKENLQRAQNQQKIYADIHQSERSFEVGDFFYLKLQLYRQSSLKAKEKDKLRPRFYGPYLVTCHIDEVAYEFELPNGSRIHVFHVSFLKKSVG